MSLFGPDLNDDSVVFNNYRVYGTILLFIMGTIVFFGVQIVNKFASLALVCVLGTIVCMFTGIIWNYNGNDLANICVVGTRLVEQVSNCTKHHIYGEELWNHFCERLDNATDIEFQNMTSEYDYKCDEYFSEQNVTYRRGIKGIASGTFSEAMWNTYHEGGDVVSDSWEESEYNLGGKSTHNYIIVDIYTSFTIIIGIFFPSVTGNISLHFKNRFNIVMSIRHYGWVQPIWRPGRCSEIHSYWNHHGHPHNWDCLSTLCCSFCRNC